MAVELTIKYLADSLEGSSLSRTLSGPDHGWVEYCNRRGQLFYADAVSDEFYQKCHQQAIDIIAKHVTQDDRKNIGFINHLSNILVNDEFILPMFGVMSSNSDQLKITTGMSRLIASMVNGRTAQELKTVVFVPHGQKPVQLKKAKPLTSTREFEKIYNLKDIDYEILMTDSLAEDMSEFCFKRSVLKHSIYDKSDQAMPHTVVGDTVLKFWSKHVRKDKIHLNIRCTPEVEKLIQPSQLFSWDVVHENASEWSWSYGRILGAYRKSDSVEVDPIYANLWLYDVTEPVHLELLLPWMTGYYTCCHSKNKKALFFDTANDVTSMQIISDWVK
jgi:hypothetical protein